jgi:hypothetical protein
MLALCCTEMGDHFLRWTMQVGTTSWTAPEGVAAVEVLVVAGEAEEAVTLQLASNSSMFSMQCACICQLALPHAQRLLLSCSLQTCCTQPHVLIVIPDLLSAW